MTARFQTIRLRNKQEWMFAVRYVWNKPQFSLDMETWHKSPWAAFLAMPSEDADVNHSMAVGTGS